MTGGRRRTGDGPSALTLDSDVYRSGDKYLCPRLDLSSLDSYVPRKAILDALLGFMPRLGGIVLDLGCGNMPYKPLILSRTAQVQGYVGMDIVGSIYSQPEVYWDGITIPLRAQTVDCVLLTEVLEHCPAPQDVLAEVARVLKPGAGLFMTVPFLFPLHDVPHDEYRYTPFSMLRMLTTAGFAGVDIEPLGGWDASLAQLVGLWAVQRPMAPWKRWPLSRIALWLMRYLLAHDFPTPYEHSPMITGLSVSAHKRNDVLDAS